MTKLDPAVPVRITKREATVRLGCSMPTLETKIKDGILPAFRIGPRSVRLNLADVEALLQPIPVEGRGSE